MTNLSTELAALMDALPGHRGDIDAYIKTLTALNRTMQDNLPAIIAALKAAETPLGDVANAERVAAGMEVIAKMHKRTITALTRQLAERDAEVKRLREALEQLARLGNGDRPGNSKGNMIARQALGDIA